jgi:hypothetical protein
MSDENTGGGGNEASNITVNPSSPSGFNFERGSYTGNPLSSAQPLPTVNQTNTPTPAPNTSGSTPQQG